jgi:exodeoxyribonuclease V alpha subunit
VKDRDFRKFRILSTLRKGPLGVDALNTILHERFSKQTNEFPIMIKRNDNRTGLSNGDTGILRGDEAHFSGDRRFALHELPPYEYAYCLSVHKSQGSEYEQVLFLIPDGSEAFGKEVLYTAVTRAKLSLDIDGNPTQIAAAMSRSSGKSSGICQKLKALISDAIFAPQ